MGTYVVYKCIDIHLFLVTGKYCTGAKDLLQVFSGGLALKTTVEKPVERDLKFMNLSLIFGHPDLCEMNAHIQKELCSPLIRLLRSSSREN